MRRLGTLLFAMLGLTGYVLPVYAQQEPTLNMVGPQIDNLYLEACTQLARGEIDAAIKLYQELLSQHPKHHQSLYQMGMANLQLRRLNEAVDFFQKAIRITSDNYWYYDGLRTAFEQKSDWIKAEETQSIVVEQFPNHKEAAEKWIDLLIQVGKIDIAFNKLESLQNKYGDTEEYLLKAYGLSNRLGKPEKAKQCLEGLLRINPENTQYYEWLYTLYKEMDKEDQAQRVLQNLLEIDPDNDFARLQRNPGNANPGQNASGLNETFERPGISLSEKLKLISGFIHSKDNTSLPEARRLIATVHTLHEPTPDSWRLFGEIYEKLEIPDSAAIGYRKSLELDPASDELWLHLMIVSYQSGNISLLREDASLALEYYPNDVDLLFFSGLSASYAGLYPEAENHLQKALRILTGRTLTEDEKNLEAYINALLGSNSAAQKRTTEALAFISKAKKSLSNDPLILYNEALVFASAPSTLAQALDPAKKAASMNPGNFLYQDTYARLLYQNGDYQAAASVMEKSIHKTTLSRSFELYGDILLKLGRPEEAKIQWNKAIQLGNSNLDIDQKLRQ